MTGIVPALLRMRFYVQNPIPAYHELTAQVVLLKIEYYLKKDKNYTYSYYHCS